MKAKHGFGQCGNFA